VPVELISDVKGADRHNRTMREEAAMLLRLVGRENYELSILLTTDRRIMRLNAYYRFRNVPTDVLSFAQTDVPEEAPIAPTGEALPPEPNLLGDIVISLETATRQARAMRQRVAQRLRTLLIHGVLHLLGYDHARSAQAKVMFAYHDELEAALRSASAQARPPAAMIGWMPR
jgi:rRNA maturation RNase YbeY